MRFLLVATIFVALIASVAAKQALLTASVGPIEEDPVPAWASKADSCAAISTCDKCSIQKDLSYCFYTEQGQATCCNRPADSAPSSGVLTASVGPIEEDPVPAWASDSDSCNAINTCDKCSPSNAQYCFYTEQGQATCCKRSSAPVDKLASGVLTASVGPIEEDPVPEWASKADKCNAINTCDKCSIKKGASYCFYTEQGQATCCARSSTSPAADMPLTASVGPIEEDPVPTWASKSDSCNAITTCDKCSVQKDVSYCFYTEQGQATCCNRQPSASSAVMTASVGPIEEDPVPAWASKADSCNAINTCDKCSVQKDVSYCFYTEEGQATCCNRNAAASSSSSDVVSASVGPIEEDPIPSWASENDVCLVIKSCDYCNNPGKAYCKYTDAGQSQCCTRL